MMLMSCSPPLSYSLIFSWKYTSLTFNFFPSKFFVNQTCDNILSVQGGRGNHALVAYQSNPIDLDRLQNTIVPMQNELSNAALRVVLRKRDQLVLF
jgi:hypothetical protein